MNPLWLRLKELRPSLPHHIHIQRRSYHGELWFILNDKSSGRFHRLSPQAYRLVALMNGRNRLQEILLSARQSEEPQSADHLPTEQDLIELMQYLHVADLLICDLSPDTKDLFARRQQKKGQAWKRLLLNPLTWRFTLGNPDRLLTRMLPLARVLATPFMGIIWLMIVGYALLQAGNHWSELTVGQLDVLFSPGNLLLLWLTYPMLKVLHELGHGLFTRVWGGHVHEFGVVVILGTPLPYVDATAATGFARKHQRLMVGAAGMVVELFFAAVALLLWLNVEPGLFRNFLYNIIIIGSVSTLFFNGNPLLRFDGYHLLCDALDTPNLATRSNQALTYLLQRYGYGVRGLTSPAHSRLGMVGFVTYAIAAFVYRLVILGVIILLVASYFPLIGLLLGVWLISFQLIVPLIKRIAFLLTSKKIAPTRRRAVSVTAFASLVVALTFFYLPMPLATTAEGVVWLPDDARVRVEAQGQVVRLLVSEGEWVEAGTPLLELENSQLIADLAQQQALLREYEARYQQVWMTDRVQSAFFGEDVKVLQATVEHLQTRVTGLTVTAPSSGYFRLMHDSRLVGRFLRQGDMAGLIVKPELPRVRVAVTQQEIGLLRRATTGVEVRLAGELGRARAGTLSQQVPAATFTLPSAVLGTAGGGRIPVDAAAKAGTDAAQMVFLLDVALPDLEQALRYGERAYVRFQHPAEPLADRVIRSLRQLFISNLKG